MQLGAFHGRDKKSARIRIESLRHEDFASFAGSGGPDAEAWRSARPRKNSGAWCWLDRIKFAFAKRYFPHASFANLLAHTWNHGRDFKTRVTIVIVGRDHRARSLRGNPA
jgi:hypothetical protein